MGFDLVSDVKQILVFEIDGSLYAVDAYVVEEIISIPEQTVLPTIDSPAATIINHKSEIFTTVSILSALTSVSALEDKSMLAMISEMEIKDNKKVSDDLRRLAFKIPSNPPYRESSSYISEEIPEAAQFNRSYLTHTLYEKGRPDSRSIKFIDLGLMVREMFYAN